MMRYFGLCAILVLAAAVSAAEEQAAPAAQAAAAAPTEGEAMPGPAGASAEPEAAPEQAVGSTDSQAADLELTVDGMTGDDILRKAGETYGRATTYYEESAYSVAADVQGTHEEQAVKVEAAVRKPDTMKVTVAGQMEMTVFGDASGVTVLNRTVNQYLKDPTAVPGGVLCHPVVQQFRLLAIATAADPYLFMKQRVLQVGGVRAAEFAGIPTYQVDVMEQGGISVTMHVDRQRFLIVGLKANIPVQPQGGQPGGAIVMTVTTQKVLVDEMPRDAEGKEIDALAFSLPEGATEVQRPSMRGGPPQPAEPEQAGSTDSQ